jgi:tetratricopeptide (TPR) repeat protein
MVTPPKGLSRLVCTPEVCVRTLLFLMLFAGRMMAMSPEHSRARHWMEEAKQTTNPVRLLLLAVKIRESLEAARAHEPENVEVRLDLVRFYTVTPRIAGGSMDDARTEAAEIAKRDAAAGHFAIGYIEYHEKNFGVARIELREAIQTGNAATKALASKWLGWLSQESQQWDEAFTIFEALRTTDPSALYEIGRTADFCSCHLDRGREAVREYLKRYPHDKDAAKVLRKLGTRGRR